MARLALAGAGVAAGLSNNQLEMKITNDKFPDKLWFINNDF